MINTTKRSTKWLFILWLLIVPFGITYTFINFPPQGVNWLYISLLTVFGFLTVYFPIIRNGTPIFLVMWVTLPTFLLFGLFVEIIVMQLSILAVLFTKTNNISRRNRLYYNSLIFFILSIIAAFVFHLVGGEVGSIEFWPVMFAIICYQLVHTSVNDIILRLQAKYLKIISPFFTKDVIMTYVTIFVVIPFALTLYFLIEMVGVGAFFLIGIPFFFVTLVIRLYNTSEKINDDLQQAGDIGHELSNKIKEKEVIDQFVENVTKMFNSEFSYLFDHKDGWLELIRSYENNRFVNVDFDPLFPGQGIAGSVLLNNKPIIYSKREDWEDISKDYSPDEMQSILCVPISRNQKIEAVLLLSSVKKDAFKEYQLKILDLLCSYFALSVEKARYVEEAVVKSERCALTKLYNYRYLDEKLATEVERLNNGHLDTLSVVLIDIDHFKQVNDTYGHHSGNDILYMLARKLEEAVPTGGFVGRYGGENSFTSFQMFQSGKRSFC